MLFQRKIDRAMKWLHDRSDSARTEQTSGEENLPAADDRGREARERVEIEKGDILAMLVAALITILPVALVVLLVLVSAMLVVVLL